MGWTSGSSLACDLIVAAKSIISNEDERKDFYEQLILSFEEADCDTLDECVGIDEAFDEIWDSLRPSDEDDDEDDW
jgi:hypothetical protein